MNQKKTLRFGDTNISESNGVWEIVRNSDEARILLPAGHRPEPKAVRQLMDFAGVSLTSGKKVLRAVATPDFHAGSGSVPVGSIVATPGDMSIPAAIGTDINCGMRTVTTGITADTFMRHKDAVKKALGHVLLHGNRNLPLTSRSFKALFDVSPEAFLESIPGEGDWNRFDRNRMIIEIGACVGLSSLVSSTDSVPDAFLTREGFLRDPCLCTIGSGNHFVEIQEVESIHDRHAAWRFGLKKGDVVFTIHSGSRDIGFAIGGAWKSRAREAHPSGIKHPESGLFGIEGDLSDAYIRAMGAAARYAWLNRTVIAEVVRTALDDIIGTNGSRIVADVPHNVILRENGLNIHRKGATPAHEGEPVIIPGSMGDRSWIGIGGGAEEWLFSCSHGAGRSIRRAEARRGGEDREATFPWDCLTLKEERLREEAPSAYKSIDEVIDVQESRGLMSKVVGLKPLLTLKA